MKKIHSLPLNLVLPAFIFFLSVSCHEQKNIEQEKSFNEFSVRMNLAYNRLVSKDIQPVFSKDFITADVVRDPSYPRRFSNYSGDLSGRYIEDMSLMAHGAQKEFLDGIVRTVLAHQKKDGRFGNDSLDFQQPDITGEHMALLWGNGRLLVGLMAYYDRSRNPEVLEACKRLGDFYLGTLKYCSSEKNIERLKNKGAEGIICFTQYIEGLAELYMATGNTAFLDACKKVYPLLPPRGNQHAHGYLTTLRGVLKLYEITKDSTELNYVLNQYNDLVHSNDLTIFGSVMEYFGNSGSRDEGCATADFVRLSLHLYRITGNIEYLRHAENAMYNALYFNQYETGDFGHHELLPDFSKQPAVGVKETNMKMLTGASSYYRMAAWWCCTMHGLRSLYSLNQNMVHFHDSKAYLDLFLEAGFDKNGLTLHIDRILNPAYPLYYEIRIDTIKDKEFFIRNPYWAAGMHIALNGKPVNVTNAPFVQVPGPLKEGDIISVGFDLKKHFIDNNGNNLVPIPENFAGYYFYGPFLMGVDDTSDPVFLAEPNDNQVYIETAENRFSGFGENSQAPFYQVAEYRHSGFPSDLKTTLRPVKDVAFEKTPMLQIRFDFEKR